MRQGFTLLELSIVIVIIGLIVAGISAGQSLVRQAGLRTIMTDIDKFRTAKNTFKLAYDAKPGDMDNAFAYWDTACAASAPLCNGDGDNRVEMNSQEMFRAWQHLVLAEILDGSYTGTSDGSYTVIGGTNAPDAGVGTGAYSMWHRLPSESAPWPYRGDMMVVGAMRTSGGPDNALFTVAEMQSIDTKMDDGEVYAGRIFGQDGNDVSANDCVTAGSAYNLATSDIACKMQIAFP